MSKGVASGSHAFSGEVRSRIAEAMATLDLEQIAGALTEAARLLLRPSFMAVITVDGGNQVRVHRSEADDTWLQTLTEPMSFGWMEPLFVPGVANGLSVVGPEFAGGQQIAAVVSLDHGHSACLVVAGQYDDPEAVRHRVANIAVESGASVLTMLRANEQADDRAALRERERLARDLHDSLSQSLWSLSMLSETAGAMIEPSDPLHAVLEQMAKISLSSQEEMRSLLINLRSAEPSNTTLARALESLVADFRKAHDVEVVASIADADLDPKEVMAFRRIAEEALNNVGRHAEASAVVVLFDADPSPTLQIGDNGAGFDTKPIEGHMGLRIMAERAEHVGCTLDIASTPGGGTAITASTDGSSVRPMPRSAKAPPLPSLRRALSLLIVGVILLASAGGAFLAAQSNRAELSELRAEGEVLLILEERTALGRVAANELIARLLQGFGVGSPAEVEAAAADREAAIIESMDVLEPMADSASVPGEYATMVLDDFAGWSDIPDELRLDALAIEAGGEAGPVVSSTPGLATPIQSVGSLATLEEAVVYSLLESVVVRYALDPAAGEFSEDDRAFLERNIGIVLGQGGYLGPDPEQPLDGGYYDVVAARVHESDALAEANDAIAAAGLWNDDQWVRGLMDGDVPPPASIEEYAAQSASALADFRSIVDARIENRMLAVEGTLQQERRSQILLGSVAVALGVLAVIALLWGLTLLLRRGRIAISESSRDHLTGIGNRKHLDGEIVPRLCDPLLNHHVVVTLDMDNFKTINDAYGHGFGDRMLEVVGAGLDETADRMPGISGVPVRIGGDEFVISFHSAEPIPLDLIHRAMHRLRSVIISAPDGTLVRCGFSYGLVEATGSPDIQSLMAASDLAAYDDKAQNRQGWRANDRLNL